MFAKGLKVETDLKLRHKTINHINLEKLQNMQSKGVVTKLPNFMERESIGICEACQLGKQLGNQGTMMDRSHERGDTGSMQE